MIVKQQCCQEVSSNNQTKILVDNLRHDLDKPIPYTKCLSTERFQSMHLCGMLQVLAEIVYPRDWESNGIYKFFTISLVLTVQYLYTKFIPSSYV